MKPTPRKPGALEPLEADLRANKIRKMYSEGWTQQKMAKALGISQGTLSKFISRRQKVVARLANTLGSKVNTERPTVVKEVADPSRLDEEQVLRSIRLGIDPERMAWLLSCKAEHKMVGRKRGVRRV